MMRDMGNSLAGGGTNRDNCFVYNRAPAEFLLLIRYSSDCLLAFINAKSPCPSRRADVYFHIWQAISHEQRRCPIP